MTTRTAIVTGGIGGLGSAMCRALADAGCRVIAADLGSRTDRIEAFQTEMHGLGDRVAFQAVDVSSLDSCRQLVADAEATHGSVDIVVNAAGITRDATLRKMELAQWQELMRVNMDSLFNMCRPAIEGMCERGFGRIINISSVNGQTGQFGQTNYSAAKAGVHGFTMALAREVARKGVTVNTVSPGYCNTALVMAVPEKIRDQIAAQVPVGRLGEPADIARAVAFLAADEAGYLTGVNLPVNGGYFMSF